MSESKWRVVRRRRVASTHAESFPVRHSYFPSHRINPKPRIVGNSDRDTHRRNLRGGPAGKTGHRYTEENELVTFFFNNIPEDCSLDFLKRKFGTVHQVWEVFCPRKRDLKGRPFGFVRFIRVEDQEELLLALNKLWIGSYKIRVFKPRFEREVICKQTETVGRRDDIGRARIHQNGIYGRIRDAGFSFKDALMGRSQKEAKQTLI